MRLSELTCQLSGSVHPLQLCKFWHSPYRKSRPFPLNMWHFLRRQQPLRVKQLVSVFTPLPTRLQSSQEEGSLLVLLLRSGESRHDSAVFVTNRGTAMNSVSFLPMALTATPRLLCLSIYEETFALTTIMTSVGLTIHEHTHDFTNSS